MTRRRKKIRRTLDAAIAAMFVALIVLPGVGTFFSWGRVTELSENRRLAELPVLAANPADVASSIAAFRAYFKDHFGFRNGLIFADSWIKYRLGVSSSNQVVVGRNGWLFYAGDRSVNSFTRIDPFNKTELAKWTSALDQRGRDVAKNGGKFVFVVVPNKETVYPEYMPRDIGQLKVHSRLDQLAAQMRKDDSVIFVDLRHDLRVAKKSERIYHLTDTHWNDRGAYVAYRTITEALAAAGFGQLAARGRDEFLDAQQVTRGKDLAMMLGLQSAMQELDLRLRPRFDTKWAVDRGRDESRTEPSKLPRIIFFGDSFSIALAPFLKENASRWVYVARDKFDLALIEREKPDIVIQELVERKLMLSRYP